MPVDDLVPYIFGNARLPLAVAVRRAGSQESPRFRAFAETYRDKIRKKVRGITEAGGYGDLQAELAVAYWLAGERRFAVEYEKYGTGKQRGPDFSITYKTHIRFDVEVTRLRAGTGEGAAPPAKLGNALCAKLLQLPPSLMNVLVLAADEAAYGAADVSAAVDALRERAAQRDDAFFMRRGFAGARDFHKHYGRLSAVRLVGPDAAPVLWRNPQARHPLPPDLTAILGR